jgi:hypothetical protein
MIYTLAQAAPAAAVDTMAPWAQLTGTAAIIMLFVWLVTKGMPALLDRHDKVQLETRTHFESIIEKIDTRRELSAREGHDAAKYLADSITQQGGKLMENTEALRTLTSHVQPRRDRE